MFFFCFATKKLINNRNNIICFPKGSLNLSRLAFVVSILSKKWSFEVEKFEKSFFEAFEIFLKTRFFGFAKMLQDVDTIF